MLVDVVTINDLDMPKAFIETTWDNLLSFFSIAPAVLKFKHAD